MPQTPMITVSKQGDIAALIQSMKDVYGRRVPYAAATALTRTAHTARSKAVPDEMRRVYDRPVPYTLNSLKVTGATANKLEARVAVKHETTSNGTLPEDFLYPTVFGGMRKEKRFERNLRYAGVLKPGWRVILGRDADTDAYGNLPRGELQRILTAVRASSYKEQNRTDSKRSRKNARNAQYFVAGLDKVSISGGEMKVTASRMQPGIYKRMGGRKVLPVMIFTKAQPNYRKLLDFAGVVNRCAVDEFPGEFARAMDDQLKKGWA